MTTALLSPSTPAAPPAAPAHRGLGRLGAFCLVAGAALNTLQAVLLRTLSSGDDSAAKLADVDAHPVGMTVMIFGGMLGVVLLLVGLQAVARVVRPHARRTAQVGAVLTFFGTLGFLGMHVLMVVKLVLAGMADRAAAVAVLEHLDGAPLLLVVFAPFMIGMFGGALALTLGLLRTAGVPRWVPACWALFLPLDIAATGVGPVDPHWLFLAGAVGIAAFAGRPVKP